MLDVRKFTFIIFTILYVLFRFTEINYTVFIAAAVLYLVIMIYGSFYIGSNFYIKIIRSVKTTERKVALTFDDGPDKEITPEVLNTLGKFGIKAAFFTVGEKISAHPDLLKKIDDEGHIIGNHTYSHSNWFDFYSAKKMIEELDKTEELIFDITGKKVEMFRPPFGVTNPALARAVKKMNYTPIGWNIRSLDTAKNKKAIKIYNRIIRQLKPGSIILLHDRNPDIVEVLEKLIMYAHEHNYEFVRLDKLMKDEAYD